MTSALKTLDRPGVAGEVRERISTLTDEDVGRWGSMSVGEMVCHLHVCFQGAAQGGISGADAGTLGLPGPLLKWGALHLPARWPHGVRTVPSLERGGSRYRIPGVFAEERDRLFTALDLFLAQRENRNPHPYFGSMSPWDWMRWGYLHADHHLRQFGR